MRSDFEKRPPEVGDRRSRAEEPPPWAEDALEAFWDLLLGGTTLAAAAPVTVLPWEIGPGPRPFNSSRIIRTLYAPNNPKQKTQADGKDVKAIKRCVSRAGFWTWQDFDTNYSDAFAHGATGPTGSGPGVDGLRAAIGTGDGSGTFNERAYHALLYGKVPEGSTHAGEWIMDQTSVNLLEDYYAAWTRDNPPCPPKNSDEPTTPPKPPASKADVQNAMAGYCNSGIANEPKIHYEQYRPMRSLGKSPAGGFTSDCSEFATATYYWARKQTGVSVPDPNGSGYNGYGYTGTLVNNPKIGAPYAIGDLAIYGSSMSNTEHVAVCFKGGDNNSSKWCSHGSEAAPYSVALLYRSDLLCVVRPGIMP